MAMKLKMDADGKVEMKDGLPVYVYDDGKEITVDVDSLFTKISELNTESKTHRLEAKGLKDQLEKFGEGDIEETVALLDMVKTLGGKEGIETLKKKSGIDVDALKRQMTESYELKLGEKDKVIGEKDGTIYKLLVSNGFNSSKFIAENLVLPPDIAEATFSKHFKIEDGQVVAYLGDEKILSRERPGEIAGIDEALQVIVDKYPMKDRILKGSGGAGSGSGAAGGAGGAGGAGIGTIRSRSDLKNDAEKTKFISEKGLDAFKALPATA